MLLQLVESYMTPSDYEKFQRQICDQIDELEQASKQSEQKETLRPLLAKFIEDGRRCGINVMLEVDRGGSILDLVERVYGKLKKPV